MLRRVAFVAVALSLLAGSTIIRAEQHVVGQKGKTFSTSALTVKAGDEVVFKNDDFVVHNIFTLSKGMEFNLKAQKPGTSNSQVFKTPGTADVRCAFHPGMKLTVTVK